MSTATPETTQARATRLLRRRECHNSKCWRGAEGSWQSVRYLVRALNTLDLPLPARNGFPRDGLYSCAHHLAEAVRRVEQAMNDEDVIVTHRPDADWTTP